jgi:transcription elongation factor Elf1
MFYAECPKCGAESDFRVEKDRDDYNVWYNAELANRGCDHVDDQEVFEKMESDVLSQHEDYEPEPDFSLYESEQAFALVEL